jgi:hypothetical protein
MGLYSFLVRIRVGVRAAGELREIFIGFGRPMERRRRVRTFVLLCTLRRFVPFFIKNPAKDFCYGDRFVCRVIGRFENGSY